MGHLGSKNVSGRKHQVTTGVASKKSLKHSKFSCYCNLKNMRNFGDSLQSNKKEKKTVLKKLSKLYISSK